MGSLTLEYPTWHPSSVKNLNNVSAELVKFNGSYHEMYQIIMSVLRGENAADEQLKKCIEMVCCSAMNVAGKFDTLRTFSLDEGNASSATESKLDKKGLQLLTNEVDLAANSLLDLIEYLQREKKNSSCADSNKNIRASTNVDSATWCSRGVKKIVYTLRGTASTSEKSSPRAVQWV